MSKNILQDIKRTKTNPIKVNLEEKFERATEIVRKENPGRSRVVNPKFASVYDSFEKEGRKNPFYTLWVVALISVVFLFFALSFLFSSAEVMINPKTKDFVFNKNFLATKGANTDSISYSSIVLSGEESKKVLAGEEKEYLEYAKGSVLIYNLSSAVQTLAINTKLEGSNGKIYKTKTKVTVPKTSTGGIPGKVSVEIYGAEPGVEYNSSPLDFKILGFKGTPKYGKFYARSVGEIAGGLKGKARQVNASDKEKAIIELKTALAEKLFKKAKDQTPKDFILFPDASFLNLDEEKVDSASSEGEVLLSIKGTFYGLLFKEKEISKKITSLLLEEGDKSDVFLYNISNLKFSLENKDLIAFTDANEINFNLSGDLKMVWRVDQNKILSEILGKNKKDFNKILSEYPDIESANLSIKPIWKTTIPENNKKIKILVNYPK